jgi:diguanylate cyclase (GGDEF)-like protein
VVAALLLKAARTDDAVGRWGGDEFVVLMPHTDEAGARLLADRLVCLVADTVVEVLGGAQVRVGITIGVADRPEEQGGMDLLNRADQDLYRQRSARVG